MHLEKEKLGQSISRVNCRGKHEIWAGQFYSRGAYTIFHQTRAENTTFEFLSRERKWYFRAGYGEK